MEIPEKGKDDKTVLLKTRSNIVTLSSNLMELLAQESKIKLLNTDEKVDLIKKEVVKLNFPIIDDSKIEKFEELGKGTYGRVYRANYNNIDAALKELSVSKVFKDIKTLLQEINMSLVTEHERVPKFHGVFFKNDFICLVFDRVIGTTLKKTCELKYKDNLRKKYNILTELVSIINDLHKMKVIHRDLKPDNIIVNDEDKVFLIDFGTSKVVAGDETKTFDAKGTPNYNGPENFNLKSDVEEDEEEEDDDNQKKNENGDEKKDKEDDRPITISVAFDVWSLGCIISEIVSGVLPWKNKKKYTEPMVMSWLSKGELFPIPEEIPSNLKAILSECFINAPDKRIKTEDLLKKMSDLRDNTI